MNTEQLLVEKKDHLLTLVLNRPEKRNALTPDMLVLLHETLTQASQEDDIRTVVIRGQGDKAFSSGYDVTAIPTRVSPELQALLDKKGPFELALDSIVNFPYPVIAMLNGYAFGGACDLTIACDMRIAVDDILLIIIPRDHIQSSSVQIADRRSRTHRVGFSGIIYVQRSSRAV